MDNENTNVQVYPTRKRVVANDKASKILFNLPPDWYSQMINLGKRQGVIEKKKDKKHGKIKSRFSISNNEGYTQILPLDEGDRSVFDVFTSEYEAGNRVLSLAMIQRALTGKVGKNGEGCGFKVYSDQRAAILNSIGKLRHTDYNPDILEAFGKLDYDDGTAEKIVKAPILSTKQTCTTINGQKTDLFYILDESPLMKIAKLKGQILTYEADRLDVPNQHNTMLVTTLKNYSLRRVNEIKKHKMTPTLTLDDIFEKCRIKDATKRAKQHARECLEKFFENLKNKGDIKSYEWIKKGIQIYSIKFTF
jgi:hypothetical protein